VDGRIEEAKALLDPDIYRASRRRRRMEDAVTGGSPPPA
jgi:hypothetical protein